MALDAGPVLIDETMEEGRPPLVRASPLSLEQPAPKRVRRGGTQDLEDDAQREEALTETLKWPESVHQSMDDVMDFTWNLSSQLHEVWWPKAPRPGKTILLTTHYSGLGTVEHCLSRLFRAFSPTYGELVLWSGHEKDEAARNVAMKSVDAPVHMFGDLLDQYAKEDVNRMHNVVEVLRRRAAVEARGCSSKEAAAKIFTDNGERCFQKLCQIARAAVAAGRVKNFGYCYTHCKTCPFFPDPDEVRNEGGWVMEAGGNSCVAFSPQGSKSRWLHPSSVATVCWLVRTESRSPDFVVQECSSCFPTRQAFEATFPPTKWDTSVVRVRCCDVGVPMTRCRNYSWTINKERLELVKDGALTIGDFLGSFQYPVMLDGHDYFVAKRALVQEFLRKELLRCKGIAVGKKTVDPASILTPGAKVRLLAYAEALQAVSPPAGASKSQCAVVDLSQNAEVRPALKAQLPSLLCGSLLWSQYHCRPWIPEEALLMMGFPVPHLIDECRGDAPWNHAFLRELNGTSLTHMAGNAMHCRVVGSFIAMGLAFTRPTGH